MESKQLNNKPLLQQGVDFAARGEDNRVPVSGLSDVDPVTEVSQEVVLYNFSDNCPNRDFEVVIESTSTTRRFEDSNGRAFYYPINITFIISDDMVSRLPQCYSFQLKDSLSGDGSKKILEIKMADRGRVGFCYGVIDLLKWFLAHNFLSSEFCEKFKDEYILPIQKSQILETLDSQSSWRPFIFEKAKGPFLSSEFCEKFKDEYILPIQKSQILETLDSQSSSRPLIFEKAKGPEMRFFNKNVEGDMGGEEELCFDGISI